MKYVPRSKFSLFTLQQQPPLHSSTGAAADMPAIIPLLLFVLLIRLLAWQGRELMSIISLTLCDVTNQRPNIG